jgi:hypothetical protein
VTARSIRSSRSVMPVHNRKRTAALFGFDCQLEMYRTNR